MAAKKRAKRAKRYTKAQKAEQRRESRAKHTTQVRYVYGVATRASVARLVGELLTAAISPSASAMHLHHVAERLRHDVKALGKTVRMRIAVP